MADTASILRRGEKEPLPDRRHTWRFPADIVDDSSGEAQHLYIDFGEYPDGRLGEIWLTASRQGTFVRGTLDALARVVSVAIQHGCPPAAIVHALRGLNYPPQGRVERSQFVTQASSVADWIAQELEAAYVTPPPPSHVVVVRPPARCQGLGNTCLLDEGHGGDCTATAATPVVPVVPKIAGADSRHWSGH